MVHLRTRSAFKRIRDNAVHGMVLHRACVLPSEEIYLHPTVRHTCLRFCTAGVNDGGVKPAHNPAYACPSVTAAGVHVMVIMISFTLFAFMMLNGVAALISRDRDRMEYLKTVSNIMLYPALFLLTAGIFIGAVWANVSWRRYWGWDPKEVWALITMLIYSLGIHQGSLKWFRNPKHFHIFCILAFLSVLVTYFGVNFLLGGLYSYA